MKTNLKLCPACNENVEYEDYDGQLFCSLCGRSEKAAEELVLQEKDIESGPSSFLFNMLNLR